MGVPAACTSLGQQRLERHGGDNLRVNNYGHADAEGVEPCPHILLYAGQESPKRLTPAPASETPGRRIDQVLYSDLRTAAPSNMKSPATGSLSRQAICD